MYAEQFLGVSHLGHGGVEVLGLDGALSVTGSDVTSPLSQSDNFAVRAGGVVEEGEHREEVGLVVTPPVSIGHATRFGFGTGAGVMSDERCDVVEAE